MPFFENREGKVVDTEEEKEGAGAKEALQGGAEVECIC